MFPEYLVEDERVLTSVLSCHNSGYCNDIIVDITSEQNIPLCRA